MVDVKDRGLIAWAYATGPQGKRAMWQAVIEYLRTRRVTMLLFCFIPLLAFPTIGLLLQMAVQGIPHPGALEQYGPLGVLAAWLMLKDYRQEQRNDKRDKQQVEQIQAIVAVLHDIKMRPCLYEVEMGKMDEPSKQKHSRTDGHA